jgi:hypothetical protein
MIITPDVTFTVSGNPRGAVTRRACVNSSLRLDQISVR